jgi:hypothetical protein
MNDHTEAIAVLLHQAYAYRRLLAACDDQERYLPCRYEGAIDALEGAVDVLNGAAAPMPIAEGVDG